MCGTSACHIAYTVFIQIDAHALIGAHPLHHQAPDRQEWVKLIFLFYQKMLLIILRSEFDSIIMYQLRFAHAQCATIRMNTVYFQDRISMGRQNLMEFHVNHIFHTTMTCCFCLSMYQAGMNHVFG